MTELAKATLTALNASNATVGEPVAVQFNPATLRMQITNRSAGGAQAGAQTRQQAGEGAVTMSFDLQFDTADEGTAEAPVSVLRKTAAVERFVRPRGNQPGDEAPPRVQFEWGAVKLQGVMDSLSLDLDLFAFDGTPLRARCAVSIKGQDAAYRYAPQGAGAGSGAASRAGGGAAGAGSGVTDALLSLATVRDLALAASATVVRALAGESLPQMAARNGRDPAKWRDFSAGGANPQSLPAGQQVAVPAQGSGAPAPAQAGPASPSGPLAGVVRAITRKGGVGASETQARRETHTGQAERRLAGFGQGAAGAAAGSGAASAASASGATPRSAAPTAGSKPASTPSRQLAANAAAPADDRPYGFGLPLKPRRATASAATLAPPRQRLRSPCGCKGSGGGRSSACGCQR